jgi:hypothetical protein
LIQSLTVFRPNAVRGSLKMGKGELVGSEGWTKASFPTLNWAVPSLVFQRLPPPMRVKLAPMGGPAHPPAQRLKSVLMGACPA